MKQGKKKKHNKKNKKKSQITKKNAKKRVVSKNNRKNNTNKKKNSASKKKVSSNNLKLEEKQKESSTNKEEKNNKVNHDLFTSLTKKLNLGKEIFFSKLKRLFNHANQFLKKLREKDKKKESQEKNKKQSKPKFKQKSPSFIKKMSTRTVRNLILISIFCLILALILLYPFGITNYRSEASGKVLDIPKVSILNEECCMYNASFKSIRSYSSLKLELEKIIQQYEKISCDGKNYFYNQEEDFTITEYGLKKGIIFNEFYITYNKGNSCELDSELKKIELLPDNYSLDAAKKDGCYVIDGEEEFNVSSYNQFLENIENKKPSTLRFVTKNMNEDLIITDLIYLEDGKFKVIYDGTRDSENTEDNRVMLAYVYDNIGIYKNKFYAYNGNGITDSKLNTNDVYYLFDILDE